MIFVSHRIKDFAEEAKNDGKSESKEATSNNDVPTESIAKPKTNDNSLRKITRNQKRRHDEINHVQKVSITFLTFSSIITWSILMMDVFV